MAKYNFKASELPISPVTLTTTLENPTGGWRDFRPVIRNKSAPCTLTCPTKVLIPHFIDSLVKGDLDSASKLLLKNNPFPSITGRLCHAPCELSCNRGRYDEPISIKQLERFVGDYLIDKKGKPPKRETGKRVAIVGSGLAGMTAAYYLRSKGHNVVVYERRESAGGYLRYHVPEYRLPISVLDGEIESLKRMGVNFITGVEVGKDISLNELMQEYDAVILAHGASREVKPNFAGANVLRSGRKILEDVREGKRPEISGKVGVVGDGATAFELARVLRRLGGDVVVISPKSKAKVPFSDRQIVALAEEEGIDFIFGKEPTEAKMSNGKVEISFEDGKLSFDDIFYAYEGEVDTSLMKDGVFIAGEAALGPSPVVNVIYSARVTAENVDAHLRGKTYVPEKFEEVVGYDRIVTDYFPPAKRVPEIKLAVEERVRTLSKEEVIGYTQEMALKEAERCFNCGFCNACGNCYVFCPDYTIKWVHGRPKVDYEFCKGCGVCSEECPRGVIDMVREKRV